MIDDHYHSSERQNLTKLKLCCLAIATQPPICAYSHREQPIGDLLVVQWGWSAIPDNGRTPLWRGHLDVYEKVGKLP